MQLSLDRSTQAFLSRTFTLRIALLLKCLLRVVGYPDHHIFQTGAGGYNDTLVKFWRAVWTHSCGSQRAGCFPPPRTPSLFQSFKYLALLTTASRCVCRVKLRGRSGCKSAAQRTGNNQQLMN